MSPLGMLLGMVEQVRAARSGWKVEAPGAGVAR
jgi:hypothetical protein